MKWRVGRSLGRTLYIRTGGDDLKADTFVGVMDTRELAAQVVEAINDPRDEYHTMAELYEYRMLYNAAFANALHEQGDVAGRAMKSYRHSDGELCFGGGWFVVYLDLPTGSISNHYENQYWDLFRIPEGERAPEWDGHTPAEAAERLRRYCEGK
jgi:hypothetical protein